MSDESLRTAVRAAEAVGWQLQEVTDESQAILRRPNYGTVEMHIAIGVLTFWTLGLCNALYAYSQYKLRSPVWALRVDPTKQYTGPSPQLRELRIEIEALRDDGWALTRQVGDRRATMIARNYGEKRPHLLVFLCTFWSWGLGNGVYALYCRSSTRRERTVRVDSDDSKNLEISE